MSKLTSSILLASSLKHSFKAQLFRDPKTRPLAEFAINLIEFHAFKFSEVSKLVFLLLSARPNLSACRLHHIKHRILQYITTPKRTLAVGARWSADGILGLVKCRTRYQIYTHNFPCG
jgi:hypothetical protein